MKQAIFRPVRGEFIVLGEETFYAKHVPPQVRTY